MSAPLGHRGTRPLAVALAAALGALTAAPYFPGCAPSHGVFPTQCVGSGCPVFESPEAFAEVEGHLAAAEVTSVVNIGRVGDWQELEPCDTAPIGGLGSPIYVGPAPDNGATIYCYRDLSRLRKYLLAHVAHQDAGDPACSGGRVGIINLAPIFSERNVLPRYLRHRRFTDQELLTRFDALAAALIWDLLASPEFRIPGESQAAWYVAVGNEIDMYLNDVDQPYPPVDPPHASTPPPARSPLPATLTATQRWADFRGFYEHAFATLRTQALLAGIPLSVGTTVRWGADPVTGDNVCGPDQLLLRSGAGQPCTYASIHGATPVAVTVPAADAAPIVLHYFEMARLADAYFFTRYFPRYLGTDPATVPDLAQHEATLKAEFQADFTAMADWSNLGTYLTVTEQNLPIIIQEVSHPSAWVAPGGNPQAALPLHTISAQQAAAVRAVFAAWADHNASSPPAPILSLNWFNLHDFAPGSFACSPGTSGYLQPSCSWGLLTPDGNLKAAELEDTSAFAFLLNSIARNPPEWDPPRACPGP